MARIPEKVIERLKEEVSLQRLVELAGVELRQQGKDLVGLCPFHEERTGSLVVSPEKNLWHCMGACQAGGSVIDWVMRAEGVSFRHAVELLRDGVAPSALNGRRSTRSTVAKLPSPLPIGAGERELLERVVGFYAQTLKESPEALGVLERRGLDESGLIEEFRLGYANRTLGYRLPAKNRKPGAELRGKLQELGVFRATGHEHLSGSLVIPVGDVNGEVVQLYGRKLRDDLNHRGSSRHLYLPGPRRGVFNAKALAAAGGELVVCESLIDALTFWRHGLRHVTAAFGADGFTDELHTALKDAGVERVLIAFDRDEAGDRGADTLSKRLGAEGVECFRVLFPAGQDANSFATSVEEPAGALAQLLREAVWIGAGEPAARPAPAPVEPEHDGARAQLEQQGDTEGERGRDADLSSAAKAAAPSSPPPSSPVPAPPGAQPVVKLEAEGELRVEIEDRRWRIRGLGKASSFELLRVNVLVARSHPRRGEVFHVDSLDLYSARARGVFARQAGEELGVAEELVARDLGRVLLTCEEHAERAVREAQAPREPEVQLSEQERERALGLLKDPGLVGRIVADFERVGVVGEQENCLIGYLAAVSRKLDRPLAVIVQSTSAAGKSALQEAVLSMVPEEERVSFSAMTGQSLFYMGESDLQHKVLAVAEEEGAERAAYALKLLQSEGELRIASTGKDGQTGRLVTHTYTVRGPVAIMLTTTTIDVDEELLNRCVVLSVDEEREQTRAIHERQRERETLGGLLAEHERQAVVKLHQDAQRLLEPLAVVNPFARALTFSDARTRTRRDHMKYLTLIRAVALLHQHQRPRRTAATADGGTLTYIEATREDILLANQLAHAVLGRSLDELPPGTRRLLSLIEAHVDRQAVEQGTVRERVRFTRRELREALGWGDTQLKVHLGRLASLELLWCHRGQHGAHVYELAWNGAGEGEARLPGLIDPGELDAHTAGEGHGYDPDRSGSGENRSGSKVDRSGGGRPPVGGRSGRGRPALKAVAAG
ncbi:MAG TPA: CHC2 zinc finger domain-containing protein [Solirubrobacteraceae bacterium]|nr:CHC2 zinc finger domain-containing protein [Solirubrobacteraceae bacterium]